MPSRGEVPELIAGFYDAGIEPERWPNVLARFAELFGSFCGGLVLAGPGGRIAQIGSLGSDPSFAHSYEQHYGCMDPVIPTVMRASTGAMLTDTMVMPKAVLERTQFYHEWVRPQGYYSILATNFIREVGNVGVAVLSRRQKDDDFQQPDLDLLALLAPHLQRSMRIQWRLRGFHSERNIALEALDRLAHGILVTDQSGRIVLANRAAEEILAEADGICSGRSGLFTAIAAQTSELRRVVAQAAGVARRQAVGGALTVDRPSLKRPYQVLVSPLRAEIGLAGLGWQAPAVLVLIIDPESGPRDVEANLRALFGLTRTEARVARQISADGRLDSVAEALGTLPTTIRTHLHRVFSKTDTRRQAELVKLVERVGILVSEKSDPRP